MLLEKKRAPRFHYGWVIVAIAFASCFVLSGIWGAYGVFYVAFVKQFGWSTSATAGAYSVFVIMAGFSASLAGWLIDRFGPRLVMPLGAVTLAVGLVLASRISELWQLYSLYATVIPIGLNCFGTVPSLRLLSNWFDRKRGTAFGIATSGFGFGALVVIPAVQALILAPGWRVAYLALAGLALALAPITGFLCRMHPGDMGLLPDGRQKGDPILTMDGQGTSEDVRQGQVSLGDCNVGQALSTSSFRVLFAMHACIGLTNIISTFQVAHVVEIGFPAMLGAAAVGLAGLMNAAGRLLGGFLSDRAGRAFAGLLGVVLLSSGASASVLATFVHQPWLLFAYGLLYGLGFGLIGITANAIAADLFRGRNYGSLAGALELGAGIGNFIGPLLGGFTFALFGTYIWAFAIAMTSNGAGGVLLGLACRGARVPKPESQVIAD